jgi:DNA-binding NarL/FixJ family response regulator
VNITLTPTQTEVFRELMRDGAKDREIGRRIYRTENTVKHHMKKIFARAGIHDRTELVVAVFRGDVVVNGVAWVRDCPLCSGDASSSELASA